MAIPKLNKNQKKHAFQKLPAVLQTIIPILGKALAMIMSKMPLILKAIDMQSISANSKTYALPNEFMLSKNPYKIQQK